MKSSPKLYNFDALYENCKETFENPKGTPLQKKSKFRKKISVVCLNVEFPTGYSVCALFNYICPGLQGLVAPKSLRAL